MRLCDRCRERNGYLALNWFSRDDVCNHQRLAVSPGAGIATVEGRDIQPCLLSSAEKRGGAGPDRISLPWSNVFVRKRSSLLVANHHPM